MKAQTPCWLIRARIQPVHLLAAGPAGVSDDERVPLAGLCLARVEVSRPAHRQSRDVGHRDLPAGGDGQGELGDRAVLAGHQAGGAVLAGPLQQCPQRCLVVGHPAAEDPLTGVVEDLREVVLLADV
jgi:hypothetical protein